MLKICKPRAYLIDQTPVCDHKALLGAGSLLRKLVAFLLVSNASKHMPARITYVLSRLELSIKADRILLAGAFALEIIGKERQGARVMLLGSSRLEHHGYRLRLHTTERDLEIVLAARFRSFNCGKLGAAVSAAGGGFESMATNPDATRRGRVESLIPETGTLLPHSICGKPNLFFLKQRSRSSARSQWTQS
jgi:ribonucleotide monophosphatase NagD (HAD superfamily)